MLAEVLEANARIRMVETLWFRFRGRRCFRLRSTTGIFHNVVVSFESLREQKELPIIGG